MCKVVLLVLHSMPRGASGAGSYSAHDVHPAQPYDVSPCSCSSKVWYCPRLFNRLLRDTIAGQDATSVHTVL